MRVKLIMKVFVIDKKHHLREACRFLSMTPNTLTTGMFVSLEIRLKVEAIASFKTRKVGIGCQAMIQSYNHAIMQLKLA